MTVSKEFIPKFNEKKNFKNRLIFHILITMLGIAFAGIFPIYFSHKNASAGMTFFEFLIFNEIYYGLFALSGGVLANIFYFLIHFHKTFTLGVIVSDKTFTVINQKFYSNKAERTDYPVDSIYYKTEQKENFINDKHTKLYLFSDYKKIGTISTAEMIWEDNIRLIKGIMGEIDKSKND